MRGLPVTIGFAACIAIAGAASGDVEKRQACQPNFTACQPAGSVKTTLPAAGSDLAPLYSDLLTSVKGLHAKRDDSTPKDLVTRDTPSICCADGTACLNVVNFNIPFCYDRFTTNFVLADGSSGTLDSGSLSIKGGPQVNLFNGSYAGGNIYGTSPPNTATLPIPTPYTSSGVGSAIPITDLAGIVTITTTIAGTTIVPTTLPATTQAIPITVHATTSVVDPTTTVVGGSTTVVSGTTSVVGGTTSSLSGSTVTVSATTSTSESTQSPTTLSGTTVPPKTSTFTTSLSGKAASTGAAAMATHRVGAGTFGVLLAVLAVI